MWLPGAQSQLATTSTLAGPPARNRPTTPDHNPVLGGPASGYTSTYHDAAGTPSGQRMGVSKHVQLSRIVFRDQASRTRHRHECCRYCPGLTRSNLMPEMFCRIRAESFGPLAERIFHFLGDDGCGTRMAAGLPGPENLMPNRIDLRVVSPDRRPLSC